MYENGETSEIPSLPIRPIPSRQQEEDAWIEELSLLKALREKYKKQS